jgi:hypothetical protein
MTKRSRILTKRSRIIYIELLVNTLEAPHIKFTLLRETMKHASTVLLKLQTLQKSKCTDNSILQLQAATGCPGDITGGGV